MFYRILRENTNTPAMTCHGAEKRDLKNQVSFCIIYLERLSDVLSDCPQLETNFEIASDFPGRDAISFYYDYLCKTEPQKLLTIKLKLPLCS